MQDEERAGGRLGMWPRGSLDKRSSFRRWGLALLGLISGPAWGCGLLWIPPSGTFPNTDEKGAFAYWKQIGSFYLSAQEEIPIFIGFAPGDRPRGSLLGAGWTIPILDSRIEQTDDGVFTFTQPDGWKTQLRRKDSSTLAGDGWVATISGDTIFCKASCGWSMRFDRGRLVQLNPPTGPGLTIERSAHPGGGSQIRQNGKPILTIKPAADPQQLALSINSRQLLLSLGTRAIVEQDAEGRRVIGQVVPALAGLKSDQGESMEISYPLADDLTPGLQVDGATYTWRPDSRELLSDGRATYSSMLVDGIPCRVRTLENGEREVFGKYLPGGISVEKRPGLKWSRTTIFQGGPMRGKPRKVEQSEDGLRWTPAKIFSYDEKGDLLRSRYYEEGRFLEVDHRQRQSSLRDSTGTLLWSRSTDAAGHLTELMTPAVSYHFSRDSTQPSFVWMKRVRGGKTDNAQISVRALDQCLQDLGLYSFIPLPKTDP